VTTQVKQREYESIIVSMVATTSLIIAGSVLAVDMPVRSLGANDAPIQTMSEFIAGLTK
jgi:hypothetical protein